MTNSFCFCFTKFQELLAQEVSHIFQTLRASQKFVEVCLSFPTLKTLHPESVNIQCDATRNFYAKVVGKHAR